MLKYENFENQLGTWSPYLKPFIESKDCETIYKKLKEESRAGKKILPESQNTYRTFRETPYGELKVVFLLQDPYNQVKNNTVVADGIAMSCANTQVLQPSLELFYDAMEEDLYGGLNLHMDRNPDLTYLCNQGIMMLNTALTVEKDKPGSHSELWAPFTIFLIEKVLQYYNNGLIFVLCGVQSQYFARFINPLQHYIFELEHPAYASRKFRRWNHNKIFTKINTILKQNNNISVIWDMADVPF